MNNPSFARPLIALAGGVLLAGCGSQPADLGPAPARSDLVAPPRAHRARTRADDGLLPGMARFRSRTPETTRKVGGPNRNGNPTCPSPELTYFGGPLLQQPVIVPVFWTSSVNAAVQNNMAQFFADVTQSSYWSWLTEYDSVGLSPGSSQAILPGTAVPGAVITPLKCAPGGANCELSDDDVQSELVRQIGLGVLPAPTLDCTGNVRTVYMVEFPPNVSLGGPDGAGNSCANQGFCGYHNTGTVGAAGTPLVYAALMDVFTGPCSFGCGSNASPLDNATDLASHELAEATTDADVGLDPLQNYADPAAWGDNDNNCGEIADICDDGSPGDTIVVSGRTWVVQELWSNQQGKCTSTGPAPVVCSGTTVTGCRLCSCGDNGGACSAGASVCETSAANVLFGACEQCTAANDTCATSTCQQSSTPSQDDVCAGCTPTVTSCPAGDNCGTIPNGCGGVVSCGGTCPAPQTCGGAGVANQCGATCLPFTCAGLGANCGQVGDGCGDILNCGSCPTGQSCGTGGVPNQCAPIICMGKTCAELGFNCGVADDGCGNTLNCGSCPANQTCGFAAPNQCGGDDCMTCAELGFNCGVAADGCGNLLNCGACPPGAKCGGGGQPNVCGEICDPLTCAEQGFICGMQPDGCNGVLDCGTCTLPEVCLANGQCGCTALTCASAGAACGALSDGCGGTLECGDCAAPETCGGGGQANQCGCTPTVCPFNGTCGETPDGCGHVLMCTCLGGSCENGVCATPTDSSSSSSGGGATTSSSSSSANGGSTRSANGGSSGESFPIYGRAGCAVSATFDARDPCAPVGGLLAFAALGVLSRRKRRVTCRSCAAADPAC